MSFRYGNRKQITLFPQMVQELDTLRFMKTPFLTKKLHLTVAIIFLNLSILNCIGQINNKISIIPILNKEYETKEINSAIKLYWDLRKLDQDKYDFSSGQLRTIGRSLIKQLKFEDGLKILKLNVEIFPDKHTVLNDYAEGYFFAGDYENSEKYYRQSLEINPNDWISFLQIEKIYNVRHYEKHEHYITMRDGVKLFTQVYIPKDKSIKHPFLFMRTPYRNLSYGEEPQNYKRRLGPTFKYSKEGFIFVFQDIRGRFLSEGKYMEMRPYKKNKQENESDESSDVYDTIEWLLQNIPNNNNKVGMYGFSYPGFYTLMGLIDAHPAIVAFNPQAPIADWFIGDDFHMNGAFSLLKYLDFFKGWGFERKEMSTSIPESLFDYNKRDMYDLLLKTGSAVDVQNKLLSDKVVFWDEFSSHDNYDKFWKDRNVLQHIGKVKASILTTGGWFDTDNLYGSLKTYETIEKFNPDINNSIIIGPWFHGGWMSMSESPYLGGSDIYVDFANASAYYQKIELSYFKHYLMGKGNFSIPEASMYDIGVNEWRFFDQWPPEEAKSTYFYFHGNNRLSQKLMYEDSSINYSEFISDPSNPVPAFETPLTHFNPDYMICDERHTDKRNDVIAFQSDILNENITIAGSIYANLFVSTSGTDSDWIIKIIDVFPSNTDEYAKYKDKREDMRAYQMLIRHGIMRGRFRNSLEKPEPFIPDTVAKVNFEIRDVMFTFKKGHRIMIKIQSSMFPIYDRNTQSYSDIYNAEDKDYVKVKNKVFHNAEYPSGISFKILMNKH